MTSMHRGAYKGAMPSRALLRLVSSMSLAAVALACAPAEVPAPPPSGPAPAPAELDLVVERGRVVDGTGAAWFRADLGLRGDRIVSMGDLSSARAKRRIDAGDRIVAPGFIDMLGQSELVVLVDNRVESKIRQGITTEVTGEGGSIAPMNDVLLGEMKPVLDKYRLHVDWTDLQGYGRRLAQGGSTVNFVTFVGAAQVRGEVLGLGDVEPSPAQLAQMEAEVEKAMEQGAAGVSTALIYPPGSYAKTEELIALARAAAKHGGVYASHIRDEADGISEALDEAFRIGQKARIPVEIWHLKVAGKRNLGRMKEVLDKIERARAEGVDVTADIYPYVASANGLDASIPEWAHDGGVDKMIARIADPAQRRRIAAEIRDKDFQREGAETILLVSCVSPALKKWMGKRLVDVAAAMGKPPEEALMDLVVADRANVGKVRFSMSEEDVTLAMQRPWVSFDTDYQGQATDGPLAPDLAHPRAFGAFPRVLGRYVRELKVLTLEEAIRKMTSLPARRMGLFDRGVLRPGMAADVVIFDPAAVRDVATFEDPNRYSEGIAYVVVNGRVVLDQGKLTAERPGRLLRR
jgi:dihydroorotase/N-acyl-D-amino-acid deacylase